MTVTADELDKNLIRSGVDQAAFEAIFHEHWPRGYAVLLRLVGETAEAEDLALEVFWRLYRRAPRLIPLNNLHGWLYRVATNLGLNAMRSRKRRDFYEEEAGRYILENKAAPDPSVAVERAEKRERVRRVLGEMAVAAHMAALQPSPLETRLPSSSAYQHIRERMNRKEQQSVFQKLFSYRYRLAWAVIGVVAILGIALAFPGVRAIANSFLGLFRVQQFTVVQVNPGDLPEQLGSSSQFQQLLVKDVQLEELGDPTEVSSAEEAGSLAGMQVRLPSALADQPQILVQPGARASFEIDLALVQALLNEIGQEDIQLPSSLDGAIVEMELPTSVTAGYGDCKLDTEAAREAGMDPDEPRPRMPDCITLVQLPSPTISAPRGLDIAKVGEAFLQVMGMTPEEAAQFSQTVDWTTTLVIPIPRYGTNYEEVSVDGVKGTLIRQNFDNHAGQYLLIWVKNDILYALTGQGEGSEALDIANSIK